MEKIKRTIKTLNKKVVSTSFGEKEKMFFTTDEAPETTISCFVGKWNGSWDVGTQIEFAQDQMKVVEKDGKTYHNLGAPPEARFQGITRNEFDILVARVNRLEEECLNVETPEKVVDVSEKPTVTEEEWKNVEKDMGKKEEPEEEISVRDIPF